MRRIIFCSFLAALSFVLLTSQAFAQCGDTWYAGPPTFDPPNVSCSYGPVTDTKKSVQYIVYWRDGYSRPVTVTDDGQNRDFGGVPKKCVRCFPQFHPPFFAEGADGTAHWDQVTKSVTCDELGLCLPNPTEHHNRHGHRCSSGGGGCTTAGFNGSCPPGTYPDGFGRCCSSGGGGICNAFVAPIETAASGDPSPMLPISGCCNDLERYACEYGGGSWDEPNCNCLSPIVIDVAGNGFDLTNAGDGVTFDITSDGVPEQISWTAANSDDAWLAYDRNGNGTIDNGKELFGSSTPQPYLSASESKNGFRALGMLDSAEYGGNNDGQIDVRDGLFSTLKLWRDRNHNGLSEAEELQSLPASVIRVIELRYRESRRHDENGNWFRYRAKVKDARGAQVGRWAWDVFLQKAD